MISQATPQSNPTSRLFESRKLSEDQALSYTPVPNRLTGAALTDLLDSRKGVRTKAELKSLADSYAIDVSLLENLAKYINTPSIGEQTTTRSVEDGEERVTSKVSSNPSYNRYILMATTLGVMDEAFDQLLNIYRTPVSCGFQNAFITHDVLEK